MGATATPPEIPLADVVIAEDELAAIAAVLRSGRLTSGERVAELETAFAARLGVAHAIATSTCSAALELAYRAVGVGPGDEVVIPSCTFVATAAAVVHCGATPVFADVVGTHDLGLDPAHVATLIGPRTRAVVAMHFGGYAADTDALRALCDRHGLALIEDSAHAPGPTGRARGDVSCFGFFANKVLPAGEGGMLATDDAGLADAIRASLSHHLLDEPRAALLLARLPRVDEDIASRRALTARYRERLGGVGAITLPYRDADVAASCCYAMPLLIDGGADRRDALRTTLRERHGVPTAVLYPATHEHSAYRERFGPASLPHSEHVARSELTLPLFPTLTEADQDRVVGALIAELGS